MEVGKEKPGVLDLLVEGVVGVPVQQVGAVHDVGRTRDLQRRDRCRCTGGTAVEETHEHDFARHDSREVVLDVLVAFVAKDLFGQRADLLVRVDDVEGPIDDPSLLLGQVEVDRMVLHREGFFLAFIDAHLPDRDPVRVVTGVDHHAVRLAQSDGVGDLEERALGGDLLELGQFGFAHLLPKEAPGLVHVVDATDVRKNLSTFFEFKHQSLLRQAICFERYFTSHMLPGIIARSEDFTTGMPGPLSDLQ